MNYEEEKLVWLLLFHAALTDQDASAASAANFADQALSEYLCRYGNENDF